jgi:hypothetical protein
VLHRSVIGALNRDAHEPAVSAGIMLEKGVAGNLYAIGLSRDERRATLGVLNEPPDGLA